MINTPGKGGASWFNTSASNSWQRPPEQSRSNGTVAGCDANVPDPKRRSKGATAFAILPTENGPVLAPSNVVGGMMTADWTLFLELATYAMYGGHGPCRIAFGSEEVAEAIDQAAVAVLFVPVSCGHGGEAAVRGVAMSGGRGYIVGAAHELYDSVDDWGAAAVLHYPLLRRSLGDHLEWMIDRPAQTPVASTPVLTQGPIATKVETPKIALAAATAKSSPLAPPVGVGGDTKVQLPDPVLKLTDKDLRHELKALGKVGPLADKTAIPRATNMIREQFLPQLGSDIVFISFANIFNRAKSVAHRKAILYVVHELFMGQKGVAMKSEARRQSCLRHFLLRIGTTVKSFRTDERESYLKAAKLWQTHRVLLPLELSQLKDGWDMD